MLRRVSENIANGAYRRSGWVDEGVPYHEFFENIVLDGSLEEVLLHTLLFGGSYVPEALRDRRNNAIVIRRLRETCVLLSVQVQHTQLRLSTFVTP